MMKNNNNLKENKVKGYVTSKFVIFAAVSDTGVVSLVGRSRGFKRETAEECTIEYTQGIDNLVRNIAN